jgi:hypothetical protein
MMTAKRIFSTENARIITAIKQWFWVLPLSTYEILIECLCFSSQLMYFQCFNKIELFNFFLYQYFKGFIQNWINLLKKFTVFHL